MEVVQDNMELLLEALPLRARWEAVASLQSLGGITLLLQLVSMAGMWNAYVGKAETLRCALDVLAICAVIPEIQLKLCENVPLPEEMNTPAISIMLGMADGEAVADADVQRSALSVIINCVCAPISRVSLKRELVIVWLDVCML